MKKIDESAKVTLTLKQLRRLVKEGAETENEVKPKLSVKEWMKLAGFSSKDELRDFLDSIIHGFWRTIDGFYDQGCDPEDCVRFEVRFKGQPPIIEAWYYPNMWGNGNGKNPYKAYNEFMKTHKTDIEKANAAGFTVDIRFKDNESGNRYTRTLFPEEIRAPSEVEKVYQM